MIGNKIANTPTPHPPFSMLLNHSHEAWYGKASKWFNGEFIVYLVRAGWPVNECYEWSSRDTQWWFLMNIVSVKLTSCGNSVKSVVLPSQMLSTFWTAELSYPSNLRSFFVNYKINIQVGYFYFCRFCRAGGGGRLTSNPRDGGGLLL